MRRFHRIGLVSLFLGSCLATGCADESTRETDSPDPASLAQASTSGRVTMPVYRVLSTGVDEARAEKLAAALGLDDNALGDRVRAAGGAIRYLNKERFQKLPFKEAAVRTPAAKDESGHETAPVDRAVDFEALDALEVVPDAEALALVEQAFAEAGLEPAGEPSVDHTYFESFEKDGRPISRVAIDTHVGFERDLDGVRLVGPGAKVKVVLDPEGEVAQLVYADRTVVRGEEMEIVPEDEADDLCAKELGGNLVEVDHELVYYAPPLDVEVGRLVPHYLCTGTQRVGEQLVPMRSRFVPAIVDAPHAAISVDAEKGTVSAKGSVSGGRAPYKYEWASSTRSMDRTMAASDRVEYSVWGRGTPIVPETVSLTVTDADGLTVTVGKSIQVVPAGLPPMPPPTPGGKPYGTFGAEWIGTCGGLGGSAGNVAGLISGFQKYGINPTFNWGEYDAWEIDFKDPVYGGQDQSFADAVDLTFYTGHGWPGGFTFCSNVNDGSLQNTEAQWGNVQNEWMVLATCLVLNNDDGGAVSRWGGSFNGLHLLLTYDTVSGDNTLEGSLFSNYMFQYSPLNVRQAWAQTAVDVQGTGVVYAYMGVYGPSWSAPNWDDYFWGMGTTGPDTSGSSIWGYWRISGPC